MWILLEWAAQRLLQFTFVILYRWKQHVNSKLIIPVIVPQNPCTTVSPANLTHVTVRYEAGGKWRVRCRKSRNHKTKAESETMMINWWRKADHRCWRAVGGDDERGRQEEEKAVTAANEGLIIFTFTSSELTLSHSLPTSFLQASPLSLFFNRIFPLFSSLPLSYLFLLNIPFLFLLSSSLFTFQVLSFLPSSCLLFPLHPYFPLPSSPHVCLHLPVLSPSSSLVF